MENGNLPIQWNDKHLSTMHKSPSVFIGMPLYNEDVHLEEALDSILNQTYKNIKIFAVDNCSTDNTRNICEKYVKIDPRMNFHKNEKNIGSGLNFLEVAKASEKANAKYFLFTRGDAFYSEKFIEKCILSLEKMMM